MKNLFLLLITLYPVVVNAQPEISHEISKKLTKYEELTTISGRMLKFYDINFPKISYSGPSFSNYIYTCIRVKVDNPNVYFYRLEKEVSNSPNEVALIEYSDLAKINKAIEQLAVDVDANSKLKPDYLQNMYVSEEGFIIGYYIKKSEVKWFIRLNNNGETENPLNIKQMINTFKEAQAKIEELKASEK